MLADSLHVVMPGQRIMRIDAVGDAFAETTPDSTKIRSTERDWLRGDTIIASFDTTATAVAAAPDSAVTDTAASKRPVIRDLVATGNASSFYQMPPQGGGRGKPALNYVRGGSITVDFQDQAVHTVTVAEQAVGMYLEEERPQERERTGAPVAEPPAPLPTPDPSTPPPELPPETPTSTPPSTPPTREPSP
jgi:hypothetical protein